MQRCVHWWPKPKHALHRLYSTSERSLTSKAPRCSRKFSSSKPYGSYTRDTLGNMEWISTMSLACAFFQYLIPTKSWNNLLESFRRTSLLQKMPKLMMVFRAWNGGSNKPNSLAGSRRQRLCSHCFPHLRQQKEYSHFWRPPWAHGRHVCWKIIWRRHSCSSAIVAGRQWCR